MYIFYWIKYYKEAFTNITIVYKIYVCLTADRLEVPSSVCRTVLTTSIKTFLFSINLNYIDVHCIKTIQNDSFSYTLCVALWFQDVTHSYDKKNQTNKNKHKKKKQEYSFPNYEYLFKKNIIVKESYKAYFRFFKMFMFGMKVCRLRVFRYQTCNFHGCKTFAKNCFYIAIYPADYSHWILQIRL